MTDRERLERKLELRQEWAEKRREKASAVLDHRPSYASDWAFITQPGHIPARARLIAREDKAYGDLNMAEHHEQCAEGIERQLKSSVFSDDENAVEALEARIQANEQKRATMREANKIYRANPKNQETPEKVAKLIALGLSEAQAKAGFSPDFCGRYGFPDYELSNLGGRITADRKRLESIKAQAARHQAAEASPNGVTIQKSGEYCSVTFAEKPEGSVLDALKAAGFWWGRGSWSGKTESLPDEVNSMLEVQS